MFEKLSDYLQERSQNIDFVSYVFDILESDPKYSRELSKEKWKQHRKSLQTRTKDQAFIFHTTNLAIGNIQIAEDKNEGTLLTSFPVGEGKEVSFFGAMRRKTATITPKKKFLSSEIIGVKVSKEDIPGLSKVETDTRLQEDILKLFKTKLVNLFGIIYVKNQRVALQTKISRNLTIIQSSNLTDNDYAEATKLFIDVFIKIATYIRQPHST